MGLEFPEAWLIWNGPDVLLRDFDLSNECEG